MNNHLLAGFSQNDTSRTPREVVHLPERVQGKEEREHRNSQDVEEHPPNHVPLAPQYKDQCLKTVNRRNHDQRQLRNRLVQSSREVDEIHDLEGYLFSIFRYKKHEQ